MREFGSLVSATIGLLLVALLLFVEAMRRRNKLYVQVAAVVAIAATLLGSWAGYRALSRVYQTITKPFRPRTDSEVYTALFGVPQPNCVHILNYQDQVVPKIDYAIWLHYRTCPAELKRVLTRHQFSREVFPTNKGLAPIPYGETISWFAPEEVGSEVVVYEYAAPSGRNIQTLWVSLDSTNVFCRDIAD